MLPAASPSRLRSGLGGGVRTALRNNLSAYGFSVMITASFGVLSASIGTPQVLDVFLFVAGAIAAMTIVDAIVTRGFRAKVGEEDSAVIELGAALGFVSVGLAVGAAAGIGALLSDWLGWVLGAFAATVAYVLLAGLEMTLARVAQEEREEE